MIWRRDIQENLFQYSEGPWNLGDWERVGTSISSETYEDPLGGQTMYWIADQQPGALGSLTQWIDVPNGGSEYYQLSWWMRKGTPRTDFFPAMSTQVYGVSTVNTETVSFDLSSGETNFSGNSATNYWVEDYSVGFWRVGIELRAVDPPIDRIRFQFFPAYGASSIWSAGLAAEGRVYPWGFQCARMDVSGTFNTYVPTTASQVVDPIEAQTTWTAEAAL